MGITKTTDVRGMTALRHRNEGGFTLVELLGVITIMAVLMAAVLGIAGIANRNADKAACIRLLQDVENAIEEYKAQHGRIPAGLQVLEFNDDIDTDTTGLPLDPWGTVVIYLTKPNEGKSVYVLGSVGPDGAYGRKNENINSSLHFGKGDDLTNANGAY